MAEDIKQFERIMREAIKVQGELTKELIELNQFHEKTLDGVNRLIDKTEKILDEFRNGFKSDIIDKFVKELKSEMNLLFYKFAGIITAAITGSVSTAIWFVIKNMNK